MNFVEIPTFTERASTTNDRFGIWGANRPGWTGAHEGGHLADLEDKYDAAGPYPGYENDIMGAQGQPVTERTIEDLITIHEGKPPPRMKGKPQRNKEPGKKKSDCQEYSFPGGSGTCGGGVDFWN